LDYLLLINQEKKSEEKEHYKIYFIGVKESEISSLNLIPGEIDNINVTH
jgi:hypothetical protein